MMKLMLWIAIDLKHDFKSTLIIINNLKVLRFESTMKFFIKCDTLFSFIPSYTPEIAPIELVFNILNKRLIKANLKNV